VVLAVGGTPVFVDVDPATRNLDLAGAQRAVTPRTRVLLPVDLAGLPVDRDALQRIAENHGLRVLADAAQSFGSRWGGRDIGCAGDLTAFSFHANKNLTTGEGGCLVLNDQDEAQRFEKLRLQGVTRHADGGMDVDVLGGKANLTDIAAAIGLGQLRSIEASTQRRRELARRYFERFPTGLGFELPPDDIEHSNWHMFQPLLPEGRSRAAFIDAMKGEGIGIGVHYPAIHLFSLYRRLGHADGEFPHAERIGRRIVTLPLFAEMTDRDVDRVCSAIERVMSRL
jgi:dTDP-4-amino-4,6-dideoxygalactose transaminase